MNQNKPLTPLNNYDKGVAIWLTGLSGSGKTTISIPLVENLIDMGYRVQILDGDVVRQKLTKDLGFSKEDRDKNIQRVTFVAQQLVRHGVIVVCAFISPYLSEREYARSEIGNFIEVFVKCPIEVCEQRDVKGLYAKARSGEIKNFTGIDDPYEEPKNAEITVNTSTSTVIDEVNLIIKYMKNTNYIS